MTCPSDQLLASQVRQGDERAFVTLVRRYEQVLARLIGQYIGTGDDGGQDVLEDLPQARRIVVDGLTYVHWYDCMTDVACGIADCWRR